MRQVKDYPKMSAREFYEKLAEYGVCAEIVVGPGGYPGDGVIRLFVDSPKPTYWHRTHCPITFVAQMEGHGMWLPSEADIAGRLLGLNTAFVRRVEEASDSCWDYPRVRGKILKALGVPEA